MGLTLLIPALEMGHFHIQNGGLYLIHACVHTQYFVLIARARAVIAQHTQPLCKRLIVREADTCFAVSSQVLAAIEAEAGDITETPHTLSLVDGSVRLG